MDAARIELKLALDEAGLPSLKLQTFSERLNVQKRIYLIQTLGYDLGYRFSWYLRGPYSRHLTDDAFALRNELDAGDTDADGFLLAESAKQSIVRAHQLWTLPQGTSVQPDAWLEVLASLHYLKEVAYWPSSADKSFDAVFAKLIESKPQFTDRKELAKQAWDRLAEYFLIHSHATA
ncbi:MAG TPA: hypothetical protein VGN12_20730 [Pirellulales bacterium]|jgi:uncharacterized protein YwgA